jgi:hypothetical protein
MIKRAHIANMVLSAQQAGATHLFLARDQFDTELIRGVPVMPGQDPQIVLAHSDEWMVECYVLQDPAVPVSAQLAEARAWHLPEDQSGAEARFAPELVALKSAVADYNQERSLAFSPQNQPPNFQRFEAARAELVEATRTAYSEGVLTPFQIRRTTGFSRREVDAPSAPRWVSSGRRSRRPR